MKKDIKLYNMILPPYLIMAVFPPFLAISAVGNFIIDSAVLLIISAIVFKKLNGKFYKKTIFKIWGLGFAADYIGVIYLFIGGYLFLEGRYTTGFLISGVVIASICIFIFDYFFVLRKSGFTKKQSILYALAYAVFTAPYTFLLPYNLFYS